MSRFDGTMYELIRTVEHVYDTGDESVLEIRAMVTENDARDGNPGVAIVGKGDESVIVNTHDHAKRLYRAMVAALGAAGHEIDHEDVLT